MTKWVWAAASCRGTSHIRSSLRLQDAYSCTSSHSDEEAFVAVVADGAGSAPMGGQGASVACRTMMVEARNFLRCSQQLPDNDVILRWIDKVRERIDTAAARRDLRPRDFAATLIFVLSFGSETLVAHIGDGSAVVQNAQRGEWVALSWPEQGEYASTTFFITDAAPAARITHYDEPITAVVLFTDGLERLALNMESKEAHRPFFHGITRPLFQSSKTGQDFDLSRALKAYLTSDAINERTDDDKTLVLAVCR